MRGQSVPPAQIVIVDASSEPVEYVAKRFPISTFSYLRHWPPSAAAQRNAGIQACAASSSLIGFADDDTTFEPKAFENECSKFWDGRGPRYARRGIQHPNLPARGKAYIQEQLVLAEWLGLYSSRPGSVSPSGWQTVIGELRGNDNSSNGSLPARRFFVERYSATISSIPCLKAIAILKISTSAIQSADMGRLAVVANAGFSHFPSTGGRVSARQFGRFEVRNRLYFVRKHHLSVSRCYLGLAIRIAMSFVSGIVSA